MIMLIISIAQLAAGAPSQDRVYDPPGFNGATF
jgi:hypothetical protein